MTFILNEDRRDLFPLVRPELKKEGGPGHRSSRFRARREKRRLVERSVRSMATALNGLYDDDPYYRDALLRDSYPASRRRKGPSVQENTFCYLEERSRVAWRRGYLCPRESAAWPTFGGYAPMLRDDKKPQTIDSTIVSLPEKDIAGSVNVLTVLPARLRSFYAGNDSLLDDVDCNALANTRRCMMIKDGGYEDLVTKLVLKGVVELSSDEPLEINGLFAVPKDGDKQRLILDARRGNLHFKPPEDPELPHPGLFTQLQKEATQDLWIGKLDLDNFYHRLELPKHLRPYFGLPPLFLNDKKVWPVYRVIPMGWSHSVAIAQAIHGEVLYSDANLDQRK